MKIRLDRRAGEVGTASKKKKSVEVIPAETAAEQNVLRPREERIGGKSMADVNVPNTPGGVFANGAKLVGDVILPGVSLAVEGDLRHAMPHAAVALAAGAMLGPMLAPLVWAAAGLNSYSRSVTGRNITDHFPDWRKKLD